jgi:hypothetical protein
MHSSENLRDKRNLEMILGRPLDSREICDPPLLQLDGPVTGVITYDLDTGEITIEETKE